jgi:hypothetical protein
LVNVIRRNKVKVEFKKSEKLFFTLEDVLPGKGIMSNLFSDNSGM